MHAPPAVYIVASDACARASLSASLAARGHAAREFASATAVLANVDADRPACLVVDVDGDATAGSALRRGLATRAPCARMVLVATDIALHAAVGAMRSGAIDVLLRPLAEADLAQAVDEALRRHAALHARDVEALRDAAGFARLTPREREVFRLLAHGQRNRQIAVALRGTEATIKVHRSRLMRKLGLSSVVELLALARRLAYNRQVIW